MNYPTSLNNLIECFKKLPGIGEKTAERLSLSVLKMDDEVAEKFSESITNVKTKIRKCKKCNNLTEDEICNICSDENRNHQTICVVDDPKNIILFEKVGSFDGVYFVLNSLISPLDGINPEDVNLNQLLELIDKEKVKEVIIAVKPSIEGETTAFYIVKLLEKKDIIVSKIANGIPIGADMEYIDPITLEMALENRNKISNKE